MIKLRVFNTISIEGGPELETAELAAQPKAMALVVYLALARPRGFHQRDRLACMFYPEFDQDHALPALRKLLSRVREALGEGAIVLQGTKLVGLAPDVVECEATAFENALARGALREAIDLCRGELLPGFAAPSGGGFEDWLESERAYYSERVVSAAWKLVEIFAAEKQLTNATHLARAVARLAPTDERMLRKVLTMLARLGDRAGAIAVYTKFAARLWRDYQTKPSLETQRLIEAIKSNEAI